MCLRREKTRTILQPLVTFSPSTSVSFPAMTHSCHCRGQPLLLLLTGVLYLHIWQHSINTYTTSIQTHNHTHTPSHSQDLPVTSHIKGHPVTPSLVLFINSPCTPDEGPKASALPMQPPSPLSSPPRPHPQLIPLHNLPMATLLLTFSLTSCLHPHHPLSLKHSSYSPPFTLLTRPY